MLIYCGSFFILSPIKRNGDFIMKKKICKCIAKNLGNINEDDLMKLIEIPPDEELGDFALPCFSFAKKYNFYCRKVC